MRWMGISMIIAVFALCIFGASGATVDPSAPPPAADPATRKIREYQRLLDEGDFQPADGWRLVVARDEIRPRAWVDSTVGHFKPGALALSGDGHAAAAGYWEKEVPVTAAETYRLTAYYYYRHVPHPRQTIHARLDWRDAAGKRAGQPDYIAESYPAGEWRRVDRILRAPEGAVKARVQLGYQWCATGSAWWDDVRFSRVAPPAPRLARVATIYHRPRGNQTTRENVESFARLIEQAAVERPDIICLPEEMTLVGTGLTYAAAAEPIPGPTTQRLGELARRHRTYIVAGLLEREGRVVYNTSVLLDRQGGLVGKYRKVYLPREEVEGGITPGADYPVFDTDFGRVGMMICYDSFFVDPARVLAAKGAELILMPIWGGDELLVRARALENHLTLVTSSYDMRTGIIDPRGEFIATADQAHPIAVAEIDLDRTFPDRQLGDMRGRFHAERRGDLPLEP